MLNPEPTNPLGHARAGRLEEIAIELCARTTRVADMPDVAFNAMIRRMAMRQLVDEELHEGLLVSRKAVQYSSSLERTLRPERSATDPR